jgi:hypothetical protein
MKGFYGDEPTSMNMDSAALTELICSPTSVITSCRYLCTAGDLSFPS